MSWWFFGRRRDGRRSLYSISIHPLVLPMLIPLLLLLLLSVFRGCV